MSNIETAFKSPSERERLIEALIAIVGEDFVLSSEDMRQKHSMDTLPENKICSLAIYPSSTSEVQAILKVARDFRCPVWPFSRGNNWGYGTKNALHENAIILILERMNRIIEVNEKLAYAVVEPGVSQKQLNDYLKKNKLKLWMDCTDSTPNGSVLGNSVERGYGYTPYGDHFAHLCGLEVVLPNGDILKTGGEHSNAKTWNTFKWGSGPFIDGLFSQSNLGIVVKAGVWLMPEPEDFQLFSFEINDSKNLPAAIDALRELSLDGIIQCHTHMVNSFQMMSLLDSYPYEKRGDNHYLSETTLSEIRSQFHLPEWSLIGGLYGSKKIAKIRKKSLKNKLGPLGTLEFFDENKINFVRRFAKFYENSSRNQLLFFLASLVKSVISPKPIKLIKLLPEIFDILKGIPNESILASAYFKSKTPPPAQELNPAQDGCGIMWLAPTLPALGSEAETILNIVKPIYQKHSFEFSGCFTLINPRTFFLLLGIFFDPSSNDEKKRAITLYQDLLFNLKEAGFYQYRLGLPSMENFLSHSPEHANFLLNLKASLDPENILAPGRYAKLTKELSK